MTITAAELLDQTAGRIPTGGRKVEASGIRARRVTPLNMRGPDIDETPPAQPTQPEGGHIVPRGVYDRTKSKPRTRKTEAAAPGEGAGDQKPRKRHAAKKVRAVKRPRQAKAAEFGLFNDGSLFISTASCNGSLDAEELKRLKAFLEERT